MRDDIQNLGQGSDFGTRLRLLDRVQTLRQGSESRTRFRIISRSIYLSYCSEIRTWFRNRDEFQKIGTRFRIKNQILQNLVIHIFVGLKTKRLI